MTKRENIQKDINNINLKIKKLEAQKSVLVIQLESLNQNPGPQASRDSEDAVSRLRNMNQF